MSTLKFSSWQDLNGNEVANSTYPPGLVLVKTQTIGSGVSSVTVTDAFSSAFDNYRIVVAGVVNSSSSSFEMRLGSKTTGYYGIKRSTLFSTGADTNDTVNNGTEWKVGIVSSVNEQQLTVVDIHGPFLSGVTSSFFSTGWGAGYMVTAAGDESSSAGSHTSLTFFPAVGTMTGGTIRVYGYNNG